MCSLLSRKSHSFFALGLLVSLMGTQTSQAAFPNVLFIAVDDLNDWIGCMKGHPQAMTPNMDRLAEKGVLFTNAHCVAPACRPSRSAVFTGKLPQQTGAWSNQSQDIIKAYPRHNLLPQFLADQGYKTFGTGKLFHGGGTEYFQQGFETQQRWSPFTSAQASYTKAELPSKGTDHPRHIISHGPGGHDYVLPLNGLRSERNPIKMAGESFDWGSFDIEDEEMGDTQITDWAMSQLNSKHEQPFFMGVGYYRPHIPLFAPQRDFDVHPPVDKIQLPQVLAEDLTDLGTEARQWALEPVTAGSHEIIEESGQWREAVRAYLACVTYVDRQLGRLLRQLENSDHANNTWIILWSDHGWHLGEKRHWGKWTGWRESTRVPLIIVPPMDKKDAVRGRRCDEPVSLLDLYPTLVEICQLPEKGDLPGQSLMPLIRQPKTKTNRQVPTMFNPGNIAITGHQWKYIRYTNGDEELYDIITDPHEWHNLANHKTHQNRLKQFRAKLPQTD
jgi:arylsulfatase A-like enzyme